MTAVEFAALQAGPFSGRPVGGALLFLVEMLSSGMFWTLVSGSTIGGVAFSLAGVMMLELAATLALPLAFGMDVQPLESHPVMTVVRLTYAVVTARLGWWTFARYEVRSGAESVAVDALGGSGVFGFVRCRPSGALANLVRKEVRLHQPTFLLAAMLVACWLAAMVVFAIPPARPRAADTVFTILMLLYVPLALVVAGTISLGEETALGVRAWHLTLPIPARVQWGVKLGVTLTVSAALVVGLPVLLLKPLFLTGVLPGGVLQTPRDPILLVGIGAAVVLAFWAASLTGHTVRAAAVTGVAIVGLGLSAALAMWAGHALSLGSDLLTSHMIRNQLPPDAFLHPAMTRRVSDVAGALSAVAVAGLALGHSYAAHRRVEVDRRQVAIYAGQLAVLTFVLVFGYATYVSAVDRQYRSTPVRELTAALESVFAVRPPEPDAAWRAVAFDELLATGRLSGNTRRWLQGSDIAVKAGVRFDRPQPGAQAAARRIALLRVTFPGGRDYRSLVLVPDAPK
jgi:hypothetical protein